MNTESKPEFFKSKLFKMQRRSIAALGLILLLGGAQLVSVSEAQANAGIAAYHLSLGDRSREPVKVENLYSPDQLKNSFKGCANLFPEGSMNLIEAQVQNSWAAYKFCSDQFAVLYSGMTKTGILVIERQSAKALARASIERKDKFFEDTRAGRIHRATLKDYAGEKKNGKRYDRGHLFPAANSNTERSMAQTFALSNMIPQDPIHNRKVWSKLEADVRKYILRAPGDVFVFTGPLFEGEFERIGPNKVGVPTHVFKVVYDPVKKISWAYIHENREKVSNPKPMSYLEFEKRTGWKLLPTPIGSAQ